MKKLLIVLLALTVVGVFAFADDAAAPAPAAPTVVITGSVDAGIEAVGWSSNSILRNYDLYNSGDSQTRGIVNFSVTQGDFVYTLQAVTSDSAPASATGGAMLPVSIAVASAKGNFFGGLLGVEFGASNNGDFGVQGDNGANYFGQGGYNENGINGGAVLTLTPVSGVEIGYGLPVISTTGTVQNGLDNSRFGLSVAVPKLVTVKAGYILNSVNSTSNLDASVSLAAIDNLGLVFEVYSQDLGGNDSDVTHATLLDVGASYTLGALTPGVQADYWLYTLSSATPSWYVKPYVNYTLDKTVLGAWFKVESATSAGGYAPGATTLSYGPWVPSTASASTYWDVAASVKQNFTPTVWGALIADYGNDGGSYGTGGNGTGAAWGTNAFSISASMSVGF